ncbi:MAG: SufD family Fe-S cluster assembly protein [Candidatus Neomarinimicrobiota bacterium]|nr:SufD family Fe-S cluster assembly protein [Candidatus Neomarinimicrobiota bacterium]
MNEIKNNSYNQFKKLGYPTKKLENWKFSNSSHLKKYNTIISDSNIDVKEYLKIKNTLCFLNGALIKESLENCDFKNEILISNTIDIKAKDTIKMSENFNNEALFNLGIAKFNEGIFIEFKKGNKDHIQINVINIYDKKSENMFAPTFNIFKLNKKNNVSIFEKDINHGFDSFNLRINKFICDDDSILNHSSIYQDDTQSNLLRYNYYQANTNTIINIDSFNCESSFNKDFIEIDLDKSGAEATVNALNLTKNDEHADNNILINHKSEHCNSSQNVRNILQNKSTSVFNGKVIVFEGAQKTDSNQSNKNLLLSKEATAHSNPQLEIYADDVQCGHGSTTGALDKNSIFYFQSRGINKEDAIQILVKAFAHTVIKTFSDDNIKKNAQAYIDKWMNE